MSASNNFIPVIFTNFNRFYSAFEQRYALILDAVLKAVRL